jgi:hypothetical protein
MRQAPSEGCGVRLQAVPEWEIVGPFEAPWEGRDVVGWAWELHRGYEIRRVVVEVSGTAIAVAPETLPEETRLARETQGRSEIERLVETQDPPARIRLGTTGYLGTPPFPAPTEMEEGWWVRLNGRRSDLETLARFFTSDDLAVVERSDEFYLRAADFEGYGDAGEIRSVAALLVRELGGVARLQRSGFQPVEVDVVTFVTETGSRQHHVHLEAGVYGVAGVEATLTVRRADGTEVVDAETAARSEQAWARLARVRPEVGRLLRLFGQGQIRWSDLYHAFEVVEAAVGGRLYSDGWATRAAVERFTRTANSPSVLGEEARHGHESVQPPANPMNFAEAQELVVGLVRRWLSELSVSEET